VPRDRRRRLLGSHLTDALVELGADVIAFVRATSSGALNNIGHLRRRLRVVFADLTDKTSIAYRSATAPGGERRTSSTSARRPTWAVVAPAVRDGDGEHGRDAEPAQSIVDHGIELEKFDTAGTSEDCGNVREAVAHHHDFDEDGGLILHERSPINPKSIYATAKVAADFLTMNYDAFGLPGVVTRMFNSYGPRPGPAYVTGTIIAGARARAIELGALEPLRDFCFCTDGVRGHLTVAARIPGDVYVYGQGENVSMADWAALILRVGEEAEHWPAGREVVTTQSASGRARAVMALRVGYDKLNRGPSAAQGLVGRPPHDRLVRDGLGQVDRTR
jgi:dTDP-glucose 4,6-dehydratase